MGARRAKTAMSAMDGFALRRVVWLARWVLSEERRAAVLASSSLFSFCSSLLLLLLLLCADEDVGVGVDCADAVAGAVFKLLLSPPGR